MILNFNEFFKKSFLPDTKIVDSNGDCMTGNVEFNSYLKNRYFKHEDLLIDRDVNSSINILKNSGQCLSQDSIKNLLLNKTSELKVY